MEEFHIDESPEEMKTVERLLKQSRATIVESISSDKAVDANFIEQIAPDIFERLTLTLFWQLYSDREQTDGYSAGYLAQMAQLRNKVLMEVENGKSEADL
ncbi:hypothetical protein KAR63_02965 [Weissella uvarum]|nr:hypothetical protein [Weissella uvarum]